MNQIAEEIISSLEELKDPKHLQFTKTSYPTSMKVIGIVSANEKLVLSELKKQLRNISGRERIELAKIDKNL